MNEVVSTFNSAQIVEIARSWVGIRYRHQAACRELGIDCVQLILEVGRATGVDPIPSIAAYRQINSPKHALALLNRFCVRIEPQAGGIVFWGLRENLPTHFGIATVLDGEPAIVHADAQIGRVVEHRLHADQQRLIHSYWWFK